MTPLAQYQKDLAEGTLFPDAQQAIAVDYLQKIFLALTKPQKRSLLKSKTTPVKGLYLWGGVGIGKTYLMDAFYHNLPIKEKMRMHFHRFMKMVQDSLKQKQGQKNPLDVIAKELAQKTRILCFDEFFVNDIADAMILANLFEALFARGITLIATSNVDPDDLYHNGLQRSKFLPAIELIKQHTDVLHLDIDKDYRLRHLTDAGVYFYPRTDENRKKLEDLFHKICVTQVRSDTILQVEGRDIEIVKRSTNILWIEFNKLCNVPRSQVDYLHIAKTFSTVILTDVPVIDKKDRNSITYFINLVDILYDTSVNLIMLAETNFPDIYPEGDLSFEFRRTKSRLQEMQSVEYLKAPHIVT